MFKAQPKWLIGLTAFAFVDGAFMLSCSSRHKDNAQTLPRMTCDDLIQNGPGANQFVTLTDAHLCSKGDVSSRDMDSALEMYVPIYSDSLKQEPQPADIALILEVLDDRDRSALLERRDVGELNVELWRQAAQLHPWVFDSLVTLYPGIHVAKCRVVSVGLHEPSLLHARSEMHQGIFSLVAAILFQFGWWIWCSLKKAAPTSAPQSTPGQLESSLK